MERRSWSAFLDAVIKAREDLGLYKEAWYRGVTSAKYRLYPSLLRPRSKLGLKHERPIFEDADEIYVAGANAPDSWERLVFLQHHGTPTRLLDWTEVFGVALYFALGGISESPPKSPAIWILNPFKLATHSRKNDDKSIGFFHRHSKYDYCSHFLTEGASTWPYSGAMPYRPPKLTPRVRSQRAFFTVHGTDLRPIDAQAPSCVRQIRLFPEAYEQARRFLKLAGIDHLTVFPDAEGFNKRTLERYA